ncbi:Histone transcription regulator 3, partial [Spiromyces aspiralis]
LKLPWSGESDRTSVDLLVSPILCLLNLALIATHRFQLGPFQVSASPSNVECPAEILASLAVRVWELVVRIWDHHPVTRAFYDNRIGSGDEETHDPSSDGTSASQSLEATDTFNFIVVTEEIHHILGERGICCQDNGRLVRCCLCIYSRLHVASGRGEVLWDDISQCTYCLYQLKVDPDGTAIEEHNTPRCGLSREDALCLYDLVRPVVIARIQQPRGTTLRSEVRAALEKLAEAIRSLDQERSAVLLYNRTVINNYLCRVPSFSFDELQRCFGIEQGGDLASSGEPASLSLLSTYSAGQHQAYKTLFYVQGAMLHDLVRSRTRVQPNQQTEDLQEVIEHYQLNLALNPFCGHAWYLLGLAYTDMANSMLLYSASEVRQSLYEIGEMQHKALLCYAQAFKRIGGVSNESRARLSFYSDPESGYCDTATLRLRSSAALLLYLMASRPMSLVGFERMTPTSNDGDPRQQQQQRLGHDSDGYWGGQACRLSNQLSSRFAVHKQLKAPPSSRVYELAAHLFGATRGIDLGNWMWTYMLGKSLSKRGMVNEACMCYLKAAFISSKGTTELVPDGVSSRGASLQYQLVDASIEPVSKLLSTLAKALLSTTMEADTASKYLNALVSQTNLRSREGAEAEAPTTGDACLREFTRMRYMTAQLCQLDK